jgi:hypothetical protein
MHNLVNIDFDPGRAPHATDDTPYACIRFSCCNRRRRQGLARVAAVVRAALPHRLQHSVIEIRAKIPAGSKRNRVQRRSVSDAGNAVPHDQVSAVVSVSRTASQRPVAAPSVGAYSAIHRALE